MKNRIVLPRKDKDGNYYISYSQLNTWKRNKRDYIRQYFFGEKFEGNAYTDFGSKVGEALEKNDFSAFDKKHHDFLKTIPRYDEFEREVRYNFDGFYLLGFIDSNTKDFKKILDYKTGNIEKKKPEYESDDYTQIHLYAGAIKQETGKLPKNGSVILIQREGNAFRGEELTIGDRYVVIDKNISLKEVKKVISDVEKIAKEISDYYKVFLKLKGHEQDNDKKTNTV